MWQQFLDWADWHDEGRVLAGLWLGAGLLLLLSGWLWWSVVSVNPQRVFWGSVNNNLIIGGVSKHIVSSGNGTKLDQTEQISLGANNVIRSQSSLTQTQNKQTTTVKTESIATPTVNYNRYLAISTSQKNAAGKSLDFSSLLGKWGKETAGQSGNGAFAQAIFDIVPFAHLGASQRQAVINTMRQDNLYNIDFSQVKKQHQNGCLVYSYPVKLTPDVYINVLKQIDADMGLNQLKNLDVSQYQGNAPIALTIYIDAHAKQLVSLSYDGSSQSETFSEYGLSRKIDLPTKTVSQTELKSQLNKLLGQ